MATVQEFTASPEELAKIPELTNEAIEAAQLNPEAGCLIDRVYPGEPLVVCFSFREVKFLRPFDFFGRTKKLEKQSGRRFNRILVRDFMNSWYHRGVPGLGDDVDEAAVNLGSIIDAISPSRIITIGQSMGGYAAILFGMLLRADRIVAFGPLSHLDAERAKEYGDRAFIPVMQDLRTDPPKRVYDDLVRLGKALNFRGELHVIFGTRTQNDDGVHGSFDAVHALRLAQLPGTILHPYPESLHAVVQWLIDNQRIDDLLATVLTEGEPVVEPAGLQDQRR